MHVVPANLSANNGMEIRNAPLAESRASRTKRNETNVQHPRSCPSFSMLVYEFDHSISKKTYISSLGKRFFFLYYIYPISILFKNCFILEIEEEFYPISIFFKNYFILEIEEEFWKSPIELTSTTDISKLRVRSRTMRLIRAFSKPNYGFTPLKQETNGNRSHATITSSSFLSLSLSYGHNYIIRCTLSCRHGGPVAHATTPCVHAYPWEPVMRWWSRFPSPCEGGRRGCTRWCCRWAIAL